MLAPQLLELAMLHAENKKKEAWRMAYIFAGIATVLVIVFLAVYAIGIIGALLGGPMFAVTALGFELVLSALLIILVWVATGTMDFLQEILPASFKDEIRTLEVVSKTAIVIGMILVPLWFTTVWDGRQAPGRFMVLLTMYFLLTLLGGLHLMPKSKGDK